MSDHDNSNLSGEINMVHLKGAQTGLLSKNYTDIF